MVLSYLEYPPCLSHLLILLRPLPLP